jgi:hypothetical protein
LMVIPILMAAFNGRTRARPSKKHVKDQSERFGASSLR